MTARKFIKSLTILHAALLLGPLLFGIYLFYTTSISTTTVQNNNNIFIYIFPVLGMMGIFGSKFLYKTFLNGLKDKSNLREKLSGFQTASLLQYALVEGPAILNLVWFGSSGNSLFLTVAAVLVIYLFTLRPTATKIVDDLKLKGDEAQKFYALDQTL